MSNVYSERFPDRTYAANMELFQHGLKQEAAVLQMMGYSGYRGGQAAVVHNIMMEKDTMCVLPTGTGKTATFVIPTIALGWRTLVFSPLKALMRDQVQKLRRMNVRAAQISTNQSPAENAISLADWGRRDLDILLVAPERLNNEAFMEVMTSVQPDMVVVDEAHCFPGDQYIPVEHGTRSMLDLYHDYKKGNQLPRAWSQNADGEVELQPITKVFLKDPKSMVRVNLLGVGHVCCTPDHVWFADRGEVPAGELVKGELVQAGDFGETGGAESIEVVSVSSLYRTGEPLFDIEVAVNHNFFALARTSGAVRHVSHKGVLVHNCLSQWSDTFRSSYCKIGDMIREFNPKVVAAFSATMPEEVEADVRRVLCLGKADCLIHYPRRTNLHLHSRSRGTMDAQDNDDIINAVQSIEGPSIIYCATIKRVERLAAILQTQLINKGEVNFYHGERNEDDRRNVQDDFMSGQIETMVATNAFGMGVDKPNIRGVFHYDMPGSLEALGQEIGRGGRDGQDAQCVAFSHEESLRTQQFFVENGNPSRDEICKVFRMLKRFCDTSLNGVAQPSVKEMQMQCGMMDAKVNSILSSLSGHQVIERFFPDEKMSSIRFINAPAYDPTFNEYKAVIMQKGEVAGDTVKIDLNQLAQDLDRTVQTVRKYLNSWHRQDLISFVPPLRSACTRIIGGLELMDFDRLMTKRARAWEKLDDVQAYFKTDDHDKHSFLEHFFLKGTVPGK